MKSRQALRADSNLIPRLYSVLLAMTLSACAQSGPTESPPPESIDNVSQSVSNACPAYETRNWRAWIDTSDSSTGTGRLNITGQIDLPSPGYSIDVTKGRLDKRNPPLLRINVAPMPPEGAALAVITSEDVLYSVETPILRYRSIVVLCGERRLAELMDVVSSQ